MRRLTIALVATVTLVACTRVYPHITLPALQLGEASFYPTLEAYTAAPIVGQNSVDVLLNGDEIFPAMLEAIRAARKTITYEQYDFEDGPIAQDLVEALADRCRDGVKGHVLLDAFGTLGMPTAYVDQMKEAGCQVVLFRSLGPWAWNRANNRNHRRVLVVDGEVGFTGGSGVSAKWMGNGREADHWRETDVRVRGPAVAYLQGAFAENWLEATGVVLGGADYFPRIPPSGEAYVQVVRSSPAGGGYAMYTMFLLAISAARRTIYITNPYFVPDAKMESALVEAAGRGVRVVILVPHAIDHNMVREASRGKFGNILRAGVKIHEYGAALLHAKTMVIDGVWSTVGSTNLDNRSFSLNDELNVVIYDRAVARRLEAVFADDLTRSRPVDYETWKRRSLLHRLLELISTPFQSQL